MNTIRGKMQLELDSLDVAPAIILAYQVLRSCLPLFGIVIHLVTTYIAISIGDVETALLTLILPFLAEVWWFKHFWTVANSVFSPYGILILVYLGVVAIRVIVNRKIAYAKIQFDKKYCEDIRNKK